MSDKEKKGGELAKKANELAKKAEKEKLSPKKIASNIARSFRDLKSEIKKIVWPNKKQIVNNTSIVITFMVAAAIFLGAVDFILKTIVDLFLRNA